MTTEANRMPHYRVRDLILIPSLVSLLRVPLALGFAVATKHPGTATAILIAAASSDVIDGRLARRFRLATPTGAIVDGLADKVFVLAALVALIAAERLRATQVLLLAVRDLGELPLAVWFLMGGKGRDRHPVRANALGKATTALQFIAIGAAVWSWSLAVPLVWLTAAVGGACAIHYGWRAADPHRTARVA